MTRPFDKHLDSDELNSLVSLREASVSGSEQVSEPSLRDAQRHVESCQGCSRKLRRHQFVHSEILRMRVPNPSPPTPQCVGDIERLEAAAGLLPEAKTKELMKHAAQCGHCGPLLKKVAEALVDEATPSEEALLASLQSTRPEWRKNMVATLRDSVGQGQQKRPWWRAMLAWPTPAYAFAGIAAIAIVAWISVLRLHTPSAEQLLAQAYSEHRTLEVRIPGAKYAPVHEQRGIGQSDFDKPQSLLKAKDLIGEELSKTPNDPRWLQAGARAELLDGNYEAAIKSLQQALKVQPDSPSLLADLGSAYFVRAEFANRPIDYGNALEALGKVLTQTPDDPVALYNQALTCEKMFLYSQAIDDWEHYLKIDPAGAWADEARERLRIIKERVRTHSRDQSRQLWELTAFPLRSINEIRNEISQRGDEYLQEATKRWLGEFSSQSDDRKREQMGTSLRILASSLSTIHSDDWLADMVASNRNLQMARALSLLSGAVEADASGRYDDGQALARRATSEFQLAGSIPGALRSRAELVYALDRSSRGRECLTAAAPLKRDLNPRRYSWISIQTATEDAICKLITASPSDAMQEARDAMNLAKQTGYNNLYLRAWSNAISIDSVHGDVEKAWREGLLALQFYWANAYPPSRLFQLCSELAFAGEDVGLWHASLRLSEEAVAALSTIHNLPVEATEHYRIASLAWSVGLQQKAEEHFKAADRIFASIPTSPTTRGFQVDAETWLASMEADRGNVDSARMLLEQARTDLNLVPTLTVPLRFYKTMGTISLHRGQFEDAERAFATAIQIAATGAGALRTTRERLLWDNEVRAAFRTLIEIRFKHFSDAHSALELWEDYRALPLHPIGLRASKGAQGINFETLEASSAVPELGLVDRIGPKLIRSTSLSYEVTPSGVMIWVLDDRGLSYAWSPIPASDLESLVGALKMQCSTPNSDTKVLDANARRIYDFLIGPIRGYLDPDRTLMVDLDDSLSGLPIEVLVDESGTMVGDRFVVARLPGIELLEEMRADHQLDTSSPALIVGPPALESSNINFPSIPDAASEASELSTILRKSQLLIGANATFDAVQARLGDVEIFHFSGHALSDEGRSGLLLAGTPSSEFPGQAELLDASRLELTKRNKLQLVVLAACSTSPRAHGTSLSADNLVMPFLEGGVPHVVATLWDVDSAATAKMAHVFYQYLLAGDPVALSLKRAKADLHRDPSLRHPYYWAGFTSFGRA